MTSLNENAYTCVVNLPGNPVKMDYSHVTSQHLILPIPQLEIDANPNLTQNPGY
jgi:hypothetical protein